LRPAEQEAKTGVPPTTVLPLWQAPQWYPERLVEAEISVCPADIAKPTSTWQRRQVKRARCRQWSKKTGGTLAAKARCDSSTRP
jgi:hypothetical protein